MFLGLTYQGMGPSRCLENGYPLLRPQPPPHPPPCRSPRPPHVFPVLAEPVGRLAAADKLSHAVRIESPDADESHAESHAIPERR